MPGMFTTKSTSVGAAKSATPLSSASFGAEAAAIDLDGAARGDANEIGDLDDPARLVRRLGAARADPHADGDGRVAEMIEELS